METTDVDVDPALALPAVLRATGLSRSALWRQVRARTFPLPIRLAPRRIGWRASAVKAWLDSRPTVDIYRRKEVR